MDPTIDPTAIYGLRLITGHELSIIWTGLRHDPDECAPAVGFVTQLRGPAWPATRGCVELGTITWRHWQPDEYVVRRDAEWQSARSYHCPSFFRALQALLYGPAPDDAA